MRIFSHSVGVSGRIFVSYLLFEYYHPSCPSSGCRVGHSTGTDLSRSTFWCFFECRARVGSSFTGHPFPLHDLNVLLPPFLSYHVIHVRDYDDIMRRQKRMPKANKWMLANELFWYHVLDLWNRSFITPAPAQWVFASRKMLVKRKGEINPWDSQSHKDVFAKKGIWNELLCQHPKMFQE